MFNGQRLDYSSDLFYCIKSTRCGVCVQAEGTDEVGLLGLQGLGTKSIYSTNFLFVVLQDHRQSLHLFGYRVSCTFAQQTNEKSMYGSLCTQNDDVGKKALQKTETTVETNSEAQQFSL